jgi:histidinol dehydrogenase
MLKPLLWNSVLDEQKKVLLQRPCTSLPEELNREVCNLIKKVQTHGDEALYLLTQQFDKVDLSTLRVTQKELDAAMNQMQPQAIQAFERVISQLTAFHQQQKISNYSVETSPGIVCERVVVPIQRVGLYVPAGSAPLVSTVLMLGVPSRMAACPLRVLCAPPNQTGTIDPYILVAARLCGIEDVFKVGGAQAIAAMAYGTESVPKVDKIFGPGNRWVTLAKMLVSLDPDGAQLDLPAGPSEVMVIADDKANPQFVAADLLSQAEHGEDSQVVLVCMSEAFAIAVNQQLEIQINALSRADIAVQSLKVSICIVVENPNDAITIANEYAPEHLILQLDNPRLYLPLILTAGSIFLGAYSPESVGDYASGTNHVLPTAGFSRSCSGLSLMDFMRTMSVQELTQEGLRSIAETIRTLTDIEGLDAHQKAIDIRLQRARGA